MIYEKRFNDFLNKELTGLVRAGYMVVLSLADPGALGMTYFIHITAFANIYQNDQQYTSTEDMFEGAEGNLDTTYDRKVHHLMTSGNKHMLESIFVDDEYNLNLYFSNNLSVHSCPPDEKEIDPNPDYNDLWWIFSEDKDEMLTAYPTGVYHWPQKSLHSHEIKK